MSLPTSEQMDQFSLLQKEERITAENFQAYLQNPNNFHGAFPIVYNQAIGLAPMIERAAGWEHSELIRRKIAEYETPVQRTGVRSVMVRVEPSLVGESGKDVFERTKLKVPGFANAQDLAEFVHAYPYVVRKFLSGWTLAINEDSQWWCADIGISVLCATVPGASTRFELRNFQKPLDTIGGILVLC